MRLTAMIQDLATNLAYNIFSLEFPKDKNSLKP